MKPIIKVENLSKQYRIGASHLPYQTLRETLTQTARKPLNWFNGNGKSKDNTIWALKDVNFEVMPGEVVGIVGRNGAGKSTLLKLLSRITEPTTGKIDLYGRVGSLLEVGTGFHAELTGRENIYLNGAILGMQRSEITRKLDEIIAFAEIEKFIDTPVKHYSSGMYMRLAFAVAAHLEPEILIVDEVLAVGDAQFQKKCLGKMEEVAEQGRTVFIVSHNLSAITSLCHQCMLLENGNLITKGSVTKIVSLYQEMQYVGVSQARDLSHSERRGNGKAIFTSIGLAPFGKGGQSQLTLRTGESLKVDLKILSLKQIKDANVALIIYDSTGYRLIDVNTALRGQFISLNPDQKADVQFHLSNLLLRPGRYLVGLWLGRGGVENIDDISYATSFTVEADAQALIHTETFPGPYQCAFTQTIKMI
jgi:lipopolysaccharide transport system ATP-binding protein